MGSAHRSGGSIAGILCAAIVVLAGPGPLHAQDLNPGLAVDRMDLEVRVAPADGVVEVAAVLVVRNDRVVPEGRNPDRLRIGEFNLLVTAAAEAGMEVTVDGVPAETVPVRFPLEDRWEVLVEFPEPPVPGATRSVATRCTIEPTAGPESGGRRVLLGLPQGRLLPRGNWHPHLHEWWTSRGQDRAPTRMEVTLPAGLTAVGPGPQVSEGRDGRHVLECRVPAAPFLLWGRWTRPGGAGGRLLLGPDGGAPSPGRVAAARRMLELLDEARTRLTDHLGPPLHGPPVLVETDLDEPWTGGGVVAVPRAWLVDAAGGAVPNAERRADIGRLAARDWFGDRLAGSGREGIAMVDEGLAARWGAWAMGDDVRRAAAARRRAAADAVPVEDGVPPLADGSGEGPGDPVWDRTARARGALLWTALALEHGEDAVTGLLADLLAGPPGRSLDPDTLEARAAEAWPGPSGGRDVLRRATWLRGPIPHLRLRHRLEEDDAGTLFLEVRCTVHADDEPVPGSDRWQVPVRLVWPSGGPDPAWVHATPGAEPRRVRLPARPLVMQVDPHAVLPAAPSESSGRRTRIPGALARGGGTVVVTATGGDERANAAARAAAEAVADWLGTDDTRIIADHELDRVTAGTADLVVVGRPGQLVLPDLRLLDLQPLALAMAARRRVTVGGRTWEGDDLCLMQVLPSPWGADRLVWWIAATGPDAWPLDLLGGPPLRTVTVTRRGDDGTRLVRTPDAPDTTLETRRFPERRKLY